MTVQTINPADLAPAAPGGLAVAGPLSAELTAGAQNAVAEVAAWLQRASMYQQLARMLVRGVFVPDAFKPEIPRGANQEEINAAFATAEANAVGAMMFGESLGLDPIVSLQNLHVIKGKPGAYAKTKVALVTAAGHEVWDEVYSADKAVVCGRRKGWPQERVARIEITMEMAKTAGWTKNETYQKTPADMLWSRAADRVCERIAGDLLRGIASVEDLEDLPEPQHTTPSRRVTAADILGDDPDGDQDQKAIPGTDTAEADRAPSTDQPDPAPAEPGAPAPLDDKQWRAMNERLREIGVAGAGQAAARLLVISRIIGRQVQRGGELTRDEGQLVIDTLTGEGGINAVWDALGETFQYGGELGERLAREQQSGPVAEDVAASGDAAPAVPGDEQEPAGWETGGDRS